VKSTPRPYRLGCSDSSNSERCRSRQRVDGLRSLTVLHLSRHTGLPPNDARQKRSFPDLVMSIALRKSVALQAWRIKNRDMAKKQKQPEFTQTKRCLHCGNEAPMEIVAKHEDIEPHADEEGDIQWAEGPCYELVKCPACGKIEFRTYRFHTSDDGERQYEVLYPATTKGPLGLPPTIKKEYAAAQQVRHTSANAYGVLMGRVLELVCEDRQAKGANLYQKLADLAQKNEIPNKLLPVADKLRIFRNLGAHASLGGLTDNEVPILENLSRAILEYVYSAPFLVEQAKIALDKLHQRRKARRKI
jgi:hypothetical protein